jgi:competence protein ComEC
MSFAATLALIAVYERGLPWTIRGADSSWGARVALWGGREVLAVVTASMVAGTATTLYAAYHFHRLAPYGVLANLLAMPVVSAWVMPVGLLGLILVPFGFDAPLWRMMGLGIEWMIGVASWVSALPGAVGRVTAFGAGPLLLATEGLLVVCLLRSPLRWSGAALAVIAIIAAVRTPLPDVLIAPEANVVAVRGADGRLAMIKIGNNDFAMRQWLAADADARTPGDPDIAAGFTCDAVGCVARLADGALVAVAHDPEAFAEDCASAALIVTRRTAPPACAAQVIDRRVWPHSGALALTRQATGFAVTAARPEGYDRPWARATWPRPAAGTTAGDSAPADATRSELDLRPDD